MAHGYRLRHINVGLGSESPHCYYEGTNSSQDEVLHLMSAEKSLHWRSAMHI
jgi:hypothetical protein